MTMTSKIITEFAEYSLKKNEKSELNLDELLEILTEIYNKHIPSTKKEKKEKTVKKEKKLSAYNIFMREELAKLKEKNPSLNARTLMTEVAKLWKEKKEEKKEEEEKKE